MPAKVLVLYTGGTFGMQPDLTAPGQPLRPMELAELVPLLQPVAGIAVTFQRFERLLDSACMTPQDWIGIARRIEAQYAEHDGFVVIHGTDTLAYTAAALSFMCENLAKPVVITGAMLPLAAPHTDAAVNYRQALQVAAAAALGLPVVPEVCVVFGGRVLRGCCTRKMSSVARSGFDSPNCPWLGELGSGLRIFEAQLRPPPPAGAPFRVNTGLETGVLDITLHPALSAAQLRHMLAPDGIRGVLLRTYGTGTAPEDAAFAAELAQGLGPDRLCVSISQCPHGGIEPGRYPASLALAAAGVIPGAGMTPEAALTKLMLALGSGTIAEARALMQVNLRGEQGAE